MYGTSLTSFATETSLDVALLLTPLISGLLSFVVRPCRHMFDNVAKQLSVTGLLHADLMAHIAFDLLDIMAMLNVVERIGASMLDEALWLYCFTAVVTTLGVALIGFISPSTVGIVNGRSSDLFISAKVLALVGTFVIDIPLLIIRIFTALLVFSSFADLDPFAYKNIVSLALRAIRLHQCRLVEVSYSKQIQIAKDQVSSLPGDISTAPPASPATNITCVIPPSRVPTSAVARRNTILTLLRPQPAFTGDSAAADSKRVKLFIKALKSARRVPVVGFGVLAVVRKAVVCLFHPYSRRFGTFLDEEIELSRFQRWRLLVPLFATWVPIIVSSVLHLAAQLSGQPPLENLLYQDGFWWGFTTPADTITTSVAGGCALIVFVCFLFLAPFHEVVFVAVGSVIRLMSFEQTVMALRIVGHRFTDERKDAVGIVIAVFAFLISCIYPLSALYSSAKVIFCTLIGRKHLYYIRSPRRRRQQQQGGASQRHQKFVTTAAALVFFNCRHQLAPLSFNKLLVGPDMVKDVRLAEGIGTSQWRDIFLILILKLWLLIAYLSMPMIIIGAVHLIYLAIYAIMARTILLVAMRKYEVRHMFVALTARRVNRSGRVVLPVGFSSINPKPNYRTLFDVDKTFMDEGFFTSPGTILPSYL
eukprot:GHVS01044917.1.p1 GENE.GHVS01044917.1~~GHVS01044917.1.p1  ORF type:complete len:646 (-),score=63.11 GHVS01044917.1:43-1980(-)